MLPDVRTADAGTLRSCNVSFISSHQIYHRSYLYRDWMMRRAIISAVIGFILLAVGIGVTVSIITSRVMYRYSMPCRQQDVKFRTDV